MAALGFVSATWVAAALMLATGLANGYIAVVAITSLQRTTADAFLGRVMSLIMLAIVGLMPISQAVAGAVVRLSPTVLFVGAGAGFVGLALLAFAKRSMWTLEHDRDTATPAPVRGIPAGESA